MVRERITNRLADEVYIRVERGNVITLTAKHEVFDVFYAAAAPGGCVARGYNASLSFPLPFTADALPFHSTVHIEYMDSNDTKQTYTKAIEEASSGYNTLSLETELQIRDPYPRGEHSFGRAWLTWSTQTVTGTDELGNAVSFSVVAGGTPGVQCNFGEQCMMAPPLPAETIQITATSPIPLYFCAGGDAPKLIPHTVSAGILGEASELLKGTTEADVIAYYHVDSLEQVVIENVRLGYQVIATWNLGLGTVHFDVTATTNILPAPEVTDVTIISEDKVRFTFASIPNVPDLKIQCFQPLYRKRTDGEWGAMCVAGIYFQDINPDENTATLPCCSGKSFEHDQDYKTELRFLATYYESSPIVPISFNMPLEPYLSRPTYDIEHITTNFAYIQMTCCIRECGEVCGTHTPSPSDEYDECHYEVEVSKDDVNWRGAGLDIEELTPSTLYHVRVRTVDEPYHRCLASDWVTKTFTTLPIKPQLTVDIPASIAAGGIPLTILTLNDAPFTFIVRNNSNSQAAIAVFLSFKGVGTGVEYPRDISGMETKPDGGQGPPGSEAYVWDNGYVSPTLLYVDPNGSGSYTLKVWLPEEAVPTGQEFANYTIHTVLKKY